MGDKLKQCIKHIEKSKMMDIYIDEEDDMANLIQICRLNTLCEYYNFGMSAGQLRTKLREYSERKHLAEIGVGLASLNLPVLILTKIYNNSVVFEDCKVPLFVSWEILKTIKQTLKTVLCGNKDMRTMLSRLVKEGKIGMPKGAVVTLDFSALYPDLSGPITQAYMREKARVDLGEMRREQLFQELRLTEEEQKWADEWTPHV